MLWLVDRPADLGPRPIWVRLSNMQRSTKLTGRTTYADVFISTSFSSAPVSHDCYLELPYVRRMLVAPRLATPLAGHAHHSLPGMPTAEVIFFCLYATYDGNLAAPCVATFLVFTSIHHFLPRGESKARPFWCFPHPRQMRLISCNCPGDTLGPPFPFFPACLSAVWPAASHRRPVKQNDSQSRFLSGGPPLQIFSRLI